MKEKRLRNIIREEIKNTLNEIDSGEMKLWHKEHHVSFQPDGEEFARSYRRYEDSQGNVTWNEVSGYKDGDLMSVSVELKSELEEAFQSQIR